MFPATPCILLSRSFSVSVTFSTKLGETPCNTQTISQAQSGHTWLATYRHTLISLNDPQGCLAILGCELEDWTTWDCKGYNDTATTQIILTTFTVGVLSKDGIFYCWKCVVLYLQEIKLKNQQLVLAWPENTNL